MPPFRRSASVIALVVSLTSCTGDGPHSETEPQPAALPPAVTIGDDSAALADAAAREGRYDDAVALMEPAVAAGGATPRLVVRLADLYLRAERPADAVARLERLVPAHPPARLPLARALLASGDARAALRLLDAAKEDSADVHEVRGRARLAVGDVAGARTALARAVAIDPRRFQVRLELARLAGHERVADVLRAWAADVGERVHASPREPGRRVELARVHVLSGRRNDAVREYSTALALAPALPAANLELALLDLAAGRADEAVPLLERVVRSIRRHRQANVLLAEHYEGRDLPARAIEHLDAAYGPHPPLDVRLRLAWLHGEAGKMDEALARARAAVGDAPRSAAAHTTLGRLHLRDGDARAATKAFEAALGIDDPNATAYLASALDTLGWVHFRRGEFADAERALTRAVRLAPREPQPQYRLGLTYQRLGRSTEAVAALRRAEQLRSNHGGGPEMAPTPPTLGSGPGNPGRSSSAGVAE
ncbi:MAG: tetratricopeptide repeat protein [Candidatus Rokubacteria bacterium]|nr:tetratricopeptide repeat protein [Candidatus Rokubacteria bacterium]